MGLKGINKPELIQRISLQPKPQPSKQKKIKPLGLHIRDISKIELSKQYRKDKLIDQIDQARTDIGKDLVEYGENQDQTIKTLRF